MSYHTERAAAQKLWYRLHIDPLLLLGLLALLLLGLVVLYSASGQDDGMVLRQILRLGMALAVMWGVAQISPHMLMRWTPILYGVGVLLLIAVELIGDIGKGAQRWLDLGVIRFQPSEIMKLAVPLMVSKYLHEHPRPPAIKHVLISLAIMLVPTLLIAKQPDLGTAILVASAGVMAVFMAGIRWSCIAAAAVSVAAFLPVLWFYLMHDYQRTRVLTLLNPESDPLGAGYHIIQSKIAIGSGGLLGKGWLQGTQSQLEFLPERHTDFIFSVFAEEFGLAGFLLLITLYMLIILRGLYIAGKGQESFSQLIGASVILTFFVYIFVNIGMVSGILPVVGVPLPLVSYGGTSMVTLMAGFGILMSIQTHKRLLSN